MYFILHFCRFYKYIPQNPPHLTFNIAFLSLLNKKFSFSCKHEAQAACCQTR